MSIFLFDELYRDAALEHRKLLRGLQSLTGGTGSIPVRILLDVHRSVHDLTLHLTALDDEIETDAPGYLNANAFLARRPGGPQTVIAFRAFKDGVDAARPALEAVTLQGLNAGAATWVQTSHTTDGVTTADYQVATAVPAGVGNAWRSHADVIAFRDALAATGA